MLFFVTLLEDFQVERNGLSQVLYVVAIALDVSFELRQREVVWIEGADPEMLVGPREHFGEPLAVRSPPAPWPHPRNPGTPCTSYEARRPGCQVQPAVAVVLL